MAFVVTESAQVERVQTYLRTTFPELPEHFVRAEVHAAVQEFADGRIRTYVPVLVQKRAKDRLRARRQNA